MTERVENKAWYSRAALLAGLASVALMVNGCGDGNEGIHSQKAAQAIAVEDYDLTYQQASPAGKFVLQYIADTTVIDILDKNGQAGAGDNLYHEFTWNNGCLQNSAYDIAGGHISGSGSFFGLFSNGSFSVEGRVPTAAADAYVDAKHPNIITIESGHANSRNLRFSGVNSSDHLTPLDKQTENVLATYGCVPPGTFTYHHLKTAAGETSDWVIRTSSDIRPKPNPYSG